MFEEDEFSGIYDDDGTKIKMDLIKKPSLCVTCKKDDMEGEENILCLLNRNDQAEEKEFKCYSYESKF